MHIPFLSLKKINQKFEATFREKLNEFLDKGFYILGNEVLNFEENFAKYCDSKYCVGVANGLDALELILIASNYPKGSEVIVPANTYYATILSILNVGLVPVLCEPNENTFLVEVSEIEKHFSEKTKAVLAVNLYGKTCDFDTLNQFCTFKGIDLLLDAAQSHGAIYDNSKNMKGVKATAYSFYPSKNLGALADAGAVVTDDEDLFLKIKSFRNYGSSKKYEFQYQGYNSRLSELQAAFLSIKLKQLDEELLIRRKIADYYLKNISNQDIVLPNADRTFYDAWHLFVIKTSNRDELKTYLREAGIETDIHYPISPHKQQALSNFNNLNLPITERIHNSVLSIPLNSALSKKEIDYIVEKLNAYNSKS